jgi:hypothetical protein
MISLSKKTVNFLEQVKLTDHDMLKVETHLLLSFFSMF